MEKTNPDRVKLNNLWVDFSALTIENQNVTHHVEARQLNLLKVLIQYQGQSVSRKRILELVWPDTIVSDNSVNQAVTQLRKLLGDNSQNSIFIKTIPKVGYQLVASVYYPEPEKRGLAKFDIFDKLSRAQTATFSAIGGIIATIFAFIIIENQFNQQPLSNAYQYESRLTSVPGAETLLKYSPDGRYLAFSQTARDRRQMDLVVYDIENQSIHTVRRSGYSEEAATWSPDGRWLAYVRHDPLRCDIRVMSVANPIETWRLSPDFHLTDCTPGFEQQKMHWPSQQTFYKVQWSAEHEKKILYRISLSTQGLPKQLLSEPLPYSPDLMDISPSGKQMLVVEQENNQQALKLVNFATNKTHVLETQLNNYRGLSWYDESSYWLGNESLRLMSLNGLSQTIHLPLGFIPDLDLNKKTGQLAYAEGIAKVNWYQLTLSDFGEQGIVKKQKMSSSARFDILPTLSADATQTAFISFQRRRLDGKSQIELWLKHQRKEAASLLVNLPSGIKPSYILWSPNNENLLLGDGQHSVYLVNIFSKRMLPVIKGKDKLDQVSWSQDGKQILYSRFVDQEWQQWQYDLELASAQLIASEPKALADIDQINPGHSNYEKQIKAYLIESEVPLDIQDLLAPSLQLYRPAVTDIGIYYVIKFGHQLSLYLYQYENGENTYIADLGNHEHDLNIVLNITASKDGKHVAYSHVEGLETDIFLQRKLSED
ncbi:winged helix-turn-helix domain-containing protein [Catenovulum sp. SM1970]|uniref:winged helix-turn-helix domain-containing protein n=1 Tax=Marinifaba aquimaris TaxID=2741323 RepID=UPI001574C096|nr:winged helix-turn-helix domain-containing protein [Marinifaba aquimaris]NTS76737.1 winged helix-turn-helix domain-containing protein [Marinifaba aquimaris]